MFNIVHYFHLLLNTLKIPPIRFFVFMTLFVFPKKIQHLEMIVVWWYRQIFFRNYIHNNALSNFSL